MPDRIPGQNADARRHWDNGQIALAPDADTVRALVRAVCRSAAAIARGDRAHLDEAVDAVNAEEAAERRLRDHVDGVRAANAELQRKVDVLTIRTTALELALAARGPAPAHAP